MRSLRNAIINLFLILVFSSPVFSLDFKNIKYSDCIYQNNIKTVKLNPNDFEIGYPIINFNNINEILLSFDKIESQFENYYYTIIHCSYDWSSPSNLIFLEYASGFEESEISDYEESQNTLISYTHYKLAIPNDNLEFTKSGNYLLVVYKKEKNENIPVITKRFMVYENIINLNGRVNKGYSDNAFGNFQKTDFSISKKGLNSLNPESDIKVTVLQNYQWNTAKFDLEYSFSDNQKIVYEWDTKSSFDANNEYRKLSLTNLDIYSEQVESIEFKKPYYYVNLFKDKSQMRSPYRSIEDQNGEYIIRAMKHNRQCSDPNTQGEYAIVKFDLDNKLNLADADIYLYGGLTNYALEEEYKMKYNPKSLCYENLLLLKQGYYDYKYIIAYKDNKKLANHSFFEGSHLQTENNYLILVYYKTPSDNYYRIINLSILNSRNN